MSFSNSRGVTGFLSRHAGHGRILRHRAKAARGGAALLVLSLAALVSFAVLLPDNAPARAQTVTTLVKNTGQTQLSATTCAGWLSGTNQVIQAQAFHSTGGGELSQVGIRISSVGSAATPEVSIRTYNQHNEPITSVQVLNNPASFTNNAVNTFTMPLGTLTLSANTTYGVVIRTTATANNANNRIIASTRTGERSRRFRWSQADGPSPTILAEIRR